MTLFRNRRTPRVANTVLPTRRRSSSRVRCAALLLVVALAALLAACAGNMPSSAALPSPPASLTANETTTAVNLRPWFEALPDPTGAYTLDEVLSGAHPFGPMTDDVLAGSFTPTTVWLRLPLQGGAAAHQWLLRVGKPTLSRLDYYLLDEEGAVIDSALTGALRPFATRPLPHNEYIFRVDVPAGTARTVLLRTVDTLPAQSRLLLYTPDAFMGANSTRQLVWGVVYGMMLVMAAYHLLLFATLRQRSYLYLALYSLAAVATYLVAGGHGQRYLWPQWPALMAWLVPLTIGATGLLLMLLTSELLETRVRAPRLHWLIMAQAASFALTLLFVPLLPLGRIVAVQYALLAPALLLAPTAALIVWRGGYTPARYFVLAQAIPLAIGLVTVLAPLLGVSLPPFVRELSIPGNILMVLFTSFALTDRISLLQAEKSRALRELGASERRMAQFLEAMPVGVSVFKPDLSLVYTNKTALDLADNPGGAPPPTLMAARSRYSFLKRGTDEPYAEEDMPLLRALRGETFSVDDADMVTRRRRFPVAMWASPVLDADGGVEYAVTAFQDISALQAAEHALAEAQDLYRRVIEDLPSLIFRFRPDGTITFANSTVIDFFGNPADQVIGNDLFQYSAEGKEASQRANLATLTAESPVLTLEEENIDAEGKRHWLQWTVRALYDPSGALQEYQALGVDVTTMREAEHELSEYRNHLENLVAARTEALSQANTDLQRRAEELAALNAITQALNSSLELDVVLGEILAQLANVVHYDNAEVFLGDAGGLAVAAATAPGGRLSSAHAPLDGANPAARVFAERHSLLLVGDRPDSWMGAPLMVGSEAAGVLAIGTAQPNAWRAEDLSLLQAFADQAAVAVVNARLFQQAQTVAVSKERERLARELHDAVTQTLFSASILAEALPAQWRTDPESALFTLEKLRHLTRGALAEMRTLLLELRPGALTEVGLDSLLRHLGEAMSGNTLVPVFHKTAPTDLRLPVDVQLAFYRIAQETLNNVAKHADATSVEITLNGDPTNVTLVISDDGKGFDPDAPTPGHLGLEIMRERARAIGATLAVESTIGQGTQLTLHWQAPGAVPDQPVPAVTRATQG